MSLMLQIQICLTLALNYENLKLVMPSTLSKNVFTRF